MLSSYTQGRDNNFNLIRFLAASLVLLSHSYVMVLGKDDFEPLFKILGMTAGSIAVDVFFLISGFLVTASILSKRNAIDFMFARGLRIYPALIVMVVSTVVGALFFSSLDPVSYLNNQQTRTFLSKNTTALFGIVPTLPGVFETNTLKGTVNGSLWTLTYELWMYSILCLFWIALRAAPNMRLTGFKIGVIVLAVQGALVHIIGTSIAGHDNNYARFFFLFFTGASVYVLRDFIPVNGKIFGFVLATVIVSALRQNVFFVVYYLALPYILFYVAYIPAGPIRKFNLVGDYSYGIYIWAFPIQQSIIALSPKTGVYQLMAESFFLTLLVAMLSWHLIEQRALALKGSCVRFCDSMATKMMFWQRGANRGRESDTAY